MALGLAALVWGPASDTWGRKPALLAATALFALTNVPLILAPNIAVLLVFRTLQVCGCEGVSVNGALLVDGLWCVEPTLWLQQVVC